MEKKKSKKKIVKNKTPITGAFHTSQVEMNGEFFTVKLPADVVDYLKTTGDKVFWTAINGVIQISGEEPKVIVPTINFDIKNFVPQSKS